jgi:hypothetical protein
MKQKICPWPNRTALRATGLAVLVNLLAFSGRTQTQPVISVQPLSQFAQVGSNIEFTVVVTNALLPSYQWTKNGAVVGTQPNLLLTNVSLSAAGTYAVRVFDSSGTNTSVSAALTVVSLSAKPVSVSLGASVALREAYSSPVAPTTFQWQRQGSNILGATSSLLAITNVQLSDSNAYSLIVSNAAGSQSFRLSFGVDPTFSKIMNGPIVTDRGYCAGGTWGDLNNSGFLDLFVFNGDLSSSTYLPFLYRNNGDGTFDKTVATPPVTLPVQSCSACWGDFDNDGNLDLFIATTTRNLLYHNIGGGAFTGMPATTGTIVTDVAYTLGAAWADYDNDGLLDLFVGGFDISGAGGVAPNFLYHNNGNGTFMTVSNSILVQDNASSLSCVWGDYDNDGYLDLFICGGTGHGEGVPRPNRLYHNNGDGTFSKVDTGDIATDKGYSGPAAWGDYDNDGFLDLFVANLDIGGIGNFLYHNNGNGTFTRITNDVVATNVANAYACAWGDYDNDGFLDLFVANDDFTPDGYPSALVNFLYHNNGDGTFTRITTGSPVNDYNDSWGCSWADYDNDGFLDLFVARGDALGNYLYHNNGNSNNWITIKLIGTLSNRAAIGAKVRVKSFYRGASRWQLRQITGGSGFDGHNELQANFGLGDATNVDLVRIEWPSGVVQELTNVAPHQLLTVVEHQAPSFPPSFNNISHDANGVVNLSATGSTNLLYLFEASANLVNWTWLGVRSNANGTVQFSDPSGTRSPRRFYRVSIP